ncbi:permease-like cell division protein FtsX [Thiobacter aerophilum]|uniref:Cell division protein FtsX n=1 Tax=Thiobacter aerophilum TaxID=3121275 RepID=A0ABV0EE82_9BURK
MRNWLAQQRAALTHTLVRLGAAPFATVLTVLVIGVALALPVSLYLAVANVARLATHVSHTPEITLFLEDGSDQTQTLARSLRARKDLARVRFVSREEALKGLAGRAGMADVIATLGRNPLPDAFVLTPKATEPTALEALRQALSRLPGVARATLDSAWAQRLAAWLALGRDFVLILAGLFGTALVAVSFNTIRLQVLAQREEIEVSRLLGATDAFVRRPFLYLGTLQGLMGALLAWLLLAAALFFLGERVDALAAAYGATFRLEGLGWHETGLLLALSGALGWLGAWLAATQHLRRL